MDDTFDDKYEFNAPKFVDFTQGDNNDDADKWFGKYILKYYVLCLTYCSSVSLVFLPLEMTNNIQERNGTEQKVNYGWGTCYQ